MTMENQQLEQFKQIYEKFKQSPLIFGYFYFPHHFRLDPPKFHITILNEVPKSQFLAIAAPRGSSKTTLIMFLTPMHWIVFRKKRCIVLACNTFKKAASALDTLKKEFKENKQLRKHYGIKIVKDAEGDSTFRHKDGFEVHIVCKGAEQLGSIRGEKFGAYRPDAILVDDLEDDEMVKNPERRESLRELYDDALMPSVDISTDFNVFVLGTILHDDSLMARLVSPRHYKEYTKFRGQALLVRDGKEVSLWEDKWSVKWLKTEEKRNPSRFAKEFQNDPVSGKEARFNKDQFRHWQMEDMQYILFNRDGTISSKGSMDTCKAAIGVDLAWSERKDADSCVLIPVYLTPFNDLLVDTYIDEKGMRPDRFAELLFTMELKLKAITKSGVPVGFEKAMLEKVTQWILKAEMRKRNHWLITKELKWETDKITRIETVLQPKYANNIVYHKQGMGDLEYQLLRFPSGTHDDIIDALQGAIRLLEYPKQTTVVVEKKADFDWWRDQAIKLKKPQKGRYIFGVKNKKVVIPFHKGF